MNMLCFSLHFQAAKFCHQAAMLLPQTCSLITSTQHCILAHHYALLQSLISQPWSQHLVQPNSPNTTLAQSHESHPGHSGRATAYTQHWTLATLCPFSSPATANGPASTQPSLACIFLPARLPLLLTCMSRLWPKRVRVPACGSPVGRGLTDGRSRARDVLIRCGFAGRGRRGVWAVLAGT